MLGNKRISTLLLACLSLAVCGSPRAAMRAPIFAAAAPFYIQDPSLQSLQLADPPPAGSEAERRDIAILTDWQFKRTAQDCARANAEAKAGYESFFGGISPFAQPMPKEAADLLDRVMDDAGRAFSFFKNRFKRPRPFQSHAALIPCLPGPRGYSYPSGHAATARILALVLADLVPQRRAEFLARADEAALNRVIGGVHYPSDIEAGKKLADEIYAEFEKNPAFLADREIVRRLLRP